MLRKINGQEDMEGAAVAIGKADPNALFYDGLQYSPPARGMWNIVHTAMLVPESHQFYICALACLRGVVLTAAEMGAMERFSSVIIEEHHLYDGSMETTIRDSIADILRRMPKLPKVAFIYPACIHHFMGCDLDGVYRELQEMFPDVRFVPCWMDPIRRQSDFTAEIRTRRQIYGALDKTSSFDKNAVNIIGSNLPVADCELKSLIEDNGFALRQLPSCETYEMYQNMAHSFLNIGQEPLAHRVLQDMEQRLGQRQIYAPVSWDYDEIKENLQCVANALHVALPAYKEEEARCEQAFADAKKLLGNMPIAIDYTAVFQPFSLARALLKHQFNVQRIYTDVCTPEDMHNFAWIQKQYPSLMIYATRHAKLRVAQRQTAEPFLAIGQKAAYFTGTAHFVNIAEGGSLRDFMGLQKLLHRMMEAYVHEKDAAQYIQQKGWGCPSCL